MFGLSDATFGIESSDTSSPRISCWCSPTYRSTVVRVCAPRFRAVTISSRLAFFTRPVYIMAKEARSQEARSQNRNPHSGFWLLGFWLLGFWLLLFLLHYIKRIHPNPGATGTLIPRPRDFDPECMSSRRQALHNIGSRLRPRR